MRIVLINFTRFGDTLQCQPLVHALKAEGHTLAWICLENFISAVEMLDGIDEVFPIPSSAILAHLKSKNPKDWHKSLSRFEDFSAYLHKEFKPDAILNLTPTNIARLMAKRLSFSANEDGKNLPIYGFGLDEFGFTKNSTVWANYIQAVTLNRLSSPYNISDGFSLLYLDSLANSSAHSARIRKNSAELLNKATDFISNLPIEGSIEEVKTPPSKGFIGFQLGASNEIRQWAISNFAKLSQIFVDEGYIPVLLGTKSETPLAEQFYSARGRAKNAIGKTDLPLLSAVLEKCEMLITNDTGTMHLAAAVERPIIGIFLATAQAWDTGPVSTDAALVEPNLVCHPCDFSTKCPHNFKCRTSIPAETIADIALKRLANNAWGHSFSEHARIWKSIRDEFGFLNLQPLDIIENNERHALYTMQRIVYKELLNILTLKNQNINKEAEIHFTEKLNSEENELIKQRLESILELIFLLQQQGKILTSVPRMKQAFLATNQKILLFMKDLRYLVPLAHMWSYGMESFGDNLDKFNEFTIIVQDLMTKWKLALEEK